MQNYEIPISQLSTGNAQSFLHLRQLLSKGLSENSRQEKAWLEYRKSYEKVAEALHTFRQDLTVKCMVPLGKRAFLKGKLIHTNEILVSLGDGYFAKKSAEQAIQVCQRRMQHAQETLDDLRRERDLYETRMLFSEMESEDGELLEEWKEEEEEIKEWKEKHRIRVREYKRKLREDRDAGMLENPEEDRDLFRRLDELEIEEELAEEYGSESEAEESSDSEDTKKMGDSKRKKSVSFAIEDEEVAYKKEEEEEEFSDSVDTKKMGDSKRKRSVSFAIEDEEEAYKKEEEEEEIIRIEFSHSKEDGNNSKSKRVNSISEELETPADLVQRFSTTKSILKKTTDTIPIDLTRNPTIAEEEEEEEENEIISAYQSVMRERIAERVGPVEREKKEQKEDKEEKIQKTEGRRISQFRRERTAKKSADP